MTALEDVVTTDRLRGIGIGRHAAVGQVALVRSAEQPDPNTPVVRDGSTVAATELPDLVTASFEAVADQLKSRAASSAGDMKEVLEATAQIAADPALLAAVLRGVEQGRPPIAAVDDAFGTFIELFTASGGLLAERVTDLKSVRERVIAELLERPAPGVPVLTAASVIVAEDLAPADTAALDLSKVVALVTELGGPTSHTAIIAGQLGLPCVVQVAGATDLSEGTVVAVDARSGELIVNPDETIIAEFESRRRFEDELDGDAEPGATADGHAIDLLANVGTVADSESAAAGSGGRTVVGTGLFRTEVLFLDSPAAPTVAEQTAAYAQTLRAFAGRKVVVRTLDAGADKPLAFATQPGEDNPALGVRGYRTARLHPDLLADQLTALAAAAGQTGTEPWVMAPMIATPAEAREFVTLARQAGLSQAGVMIEVPAAAILARQMLAEVDFVSLGTNDLSQYTMAADRLRGELADLLDLWQPAVLSLVAATASAGSELGKPVGVCGEAAGDPLHALALVGLGVTSLSMSPRSVPAVRWALRRHTLAQCQVIAQAALGASSATEARQAALDHLDESVRTAPLFS